MLEQPNQTQILPEESVHSVPLAIIVALSTVAVYLDAHYRGVGRVKLPASKGLPARITFMPPTVWASCVFLLWFAFFPSYLLLRSKLIRDAQEFPGKPGRFVWAKTSLFSALGIALVLFSIQNQP